MALILRASDGSLWELSVSTGGITSVTASSGTPAAYVGLGTVTALDMIKAAMRATGALASGETPTSDESADALLILNQMVDAWSIESLNLFERQRTTHALTTDDGTYTMGSGGDFNTIRPVLIEKFGIVSNSVEYPMESLTMSEWADIPVKTLTSSYPTKIWDDGGYPLRTFNVYPVPTDSCTLVIYSPEAMNTFASTSTEVIVPPGYERALKFNLAVELAAEGIGRLRPEIAALAVESKAAIKRANITPLKLKPDVALVNAAHYNINTDGY